MTKIWWVRHGPTHMKSMVGWSDIAADLSDHALIARVKEYLPRKAVIVSSDLSRAIDTATAISATQPRLPHRAGLREMNFGDWELCTASDVEAKTAVHIRAFWENPGDIAPPNGESWNMLCHRVDRQVDLLVKDHNGQDIIAVAHFGTILTQVQRSLGVSPYQAFAQKIDNLSVTCLALDNGLWRAESINHIP